MMGIIDDIFDWSFDHPFLFLSSLCSLVVAIIVGAAYLEASACAAAHGHLVESPEVTYVMAGRVMVPTYSQVCVTGPGDAP